MKLLFPALACALALSACGANPERAAERRADLNAKIFPNPADRQGIYLAFPLESAGIVNLLLTHDANMVGRADVSQRVAAFCRRQNNDRLTGGVGVKGEPRTDTKSIPGRVLVTTNYRCIKR